jgi:aminomethyltransferase
MLVSLKHTPLAALHLAAGARMVDFGGWNMPLAYGSQIEEHHAVRQNAGMFDVSHMQNVDLAGPDTRVFLRRLLANDVDKLTTVGRALYSCMLNPTGGVIDDLIVYFFADDQWRMVVNAATAPKDVAWMNRVAQAGGFDVRLTPRTDLAMIAVQGPNARTKVWAARPAWQAASEPLAPFNAARLDGDVLVARTGYTGEDGFEIVVPAADAATLWQDLVDVGVRPCGLAARDTLRLEAGMNLYGQDMDDLVLPGEAGLTWTVSLKDVARDFIGRAALSLARPVSWVGLKLAERGVIRANMMVHTTLGVGQTTSGTMSPTLGVSIAFARLPADVRPGDRVEVEIRGKRVPATVCALPFVRHGKAVDAR